MLSIYTTENIISAIFKDDQNKYDAWYDFIIKLRPAMKILLNIDSDYDINDYNPVYMFQKDYDIDVEPEYLEEVGEGSYLNQIINMTLSSVSDPFAVFLLDIDDDYAEQISEKYGVICHSISTNPLCCPLFQEGIEKSIDKDERRNGWKELFCEENTIPSNYLVFIDRYLFADSSVLTVQDALNNISEILDAALPDKLGVDFHILLIFDNTVATKNPITFNQISSKINGIKKRIKRPYNINIEVISINRSDYNYDETHNRRILSNYYIVRMDHSIKAFKDGRGAYTQTMWLDWIASKGVASHKSSDPPAKALYRYTKETIETIKQLQKKSEETPFSQNGNCNISIQNIKHRILQ